jgi:glutaredoxin 3
MPDVTIYTRDFCPYCVRAKHLLGGKDVKYTEINAGKDTKLRAEMVERAGGRNTFPQIFIGDLHIGGCDDLVALNEAGKLDALLTAS